MDTVNITQNDRDYLKVLGTLVYDYEQQHEIIPTLQEVEEMKRLGNFTNH
ncbi:hypothetical protein VB713_10410 [Anabaena cylindrica UHCC 0172]|nr:hypothetical protein [Anabaena cylindrica UHCC 0172]